MWVYDVYKAWMALPERFTSFDVPRGNNREIVQRLKADGLIEKVAIIRVRKPTGDQRTAPVNVYCKVHMPTGAVYNLLKHYFGYNPNIMPEVST